MFISLLTIPFLPALCRFQVFFSETCRAERLSRAGSFNHNGYEMETGKNILVTGASGFIGAHLVKAVANRNCQVIATCRSEAGESALRSAGVQTVRIDLAKATLEDLDRQLPDVDTVYHLAGAVSGPVAELTRVNGEGARILAASYARRSPPPTFVLLSSIAAGGPSSKETPREEHFDPSPVSHYGRSKLEGERGVASFYEKMPVSVVRPGIVFGPGDKEFIRILQSMYRVRLNPMIGWGNQPLALIEVSDLVDLILRIASDGERVVGVSSKGDPERGAGVYYAAAQTPLTLKKLGKIFSVTLNQSVVQVPFHPWMAWALGVSGECFSKLTGLKTTLSRDKIREGVEAGWWVSVNKAERQLAWQPKLSLEETMRNWIQQAQKDGLL